jgi:hypothetical protein
MIVKSFGTCNMFFGLLHNGMALSGFAVDFLGEMPAGKCYVVK